MTTSEMAAAGATSTLDRPEPGTDPAPAPESHYDVIVIGSGMGGLSTASTWPPKVVRCWRARRWTV